MAKTYSDDTITRTLELLQANRGNCRGTARELELPSRTVTSWWSQFQEAEHEITAAEREGREPSLRTRVGRIAMDRAKLRAQKAPPARELSPDLPLEKQLQAFLAALQGELVPRLGKMSDRDLMRLFGITTDKLINLMRPQDQAAGGSSFLAILQAVQNQQVNVK